MRSRVLPSRIIPASWNPQLDHTEVSVYDAQAPSLLNPTRRARFYERTPTPKSVQRPNLLEENRQTPTIDAGEDIKALLESHQITGTIWDVIPETPLSTGASVSFLSAQSSEVPREPAYSPKSLAPFERLSDNDGIHSSPDASDSLNFHTPHRPHYEFASFSDVLHDPPVPGDNSRKHESRMPDEAPSPTLKRMKTNKCMDKGLKKCEGGPKDTLARRIKILGPKKVNADKRLSTTKDRYLTPTKEPAVRYTLDDYIRRLEFNFLEMHNKLPKSIKSFGDYKHTFLEKTNLGAKAQTQYLNEGSSTKRQDMYVKKIDDPFLTSKIIDNPEIISFLRHHDRHKLANIGTSKDPSSETRTSQKNSRSEEKSTALDLNTHVEFKSVSISEQASGVCSNTGIASSVDTVFERRRLNGERHLVTNTLQFLPEIRSEGVLHSHVHEERKFPQENGEQKHAGNMRWPDLPTCPPKFCDTASQSLTKLLADQNSGGYMY